MGLGRGEEGMGGDRHASPTSLSLSLLSSLMGLGGGGRRGGEGTGQGEGTQPPSLLSPPGAGSVRLCNAMEADSCPTPHPSPPAS